MADLAVALWGATETGKTTCLATYVCHYRPDEHGLLEIANPDSHEAVHRLSEVHDRLVNNLLPPGTSTPPDPYRFRLKGTGEAIELRDMRGGDVGDVDAKRTLAQADAVIYFIEWPTRLADLVAIRRANLHRGVKHQDAIVVTKCEKYLADSEFKEAIVTSRDCETLPDEYRETLRSLAPNRVFLTTVYGWQRGGRPAQFLNEVGRQVPWKIAPEGIKRAFDEALMGVLAR